MGLILGIVGSGLKLLSTIASWFANKQLIDAGQAEQKAADQGAALQEEGKAHDAEISVDAAGDAALDRLRDTWTRKP